MPHVIVKLYAGRSEQQKDHLAKEITRVVMASTGNNEDAVSVAIKDVAPSKWLEEVYKTEILGNWDSLYQKPDYRLG